MTAERWRPLPGLENSYEVSDQGRVRSLTRLVPWRNGKMRTQYGRLLKLIPMNDRRVVCLCVGDRKLNRMVGVHRLVLLAFVGPPRPGQECCHNNGDPTDNRLENLRWATHRDNVLDAVAHGTHPMVAKTHCPQGHPLAHPNLALYCLPERRCLICTRAISRRTAQRRRAAAKAERNGTPA